MTVMISVTTSCYIIGGSEELRALLCRIALAVVKKLPRKIVVSQLDEISLTYCLCCCLMTCCMDASSQTIYTYIYTFLRFVRALTIVKEITCVSKKAGWRHACQLVAKTNQRILQTTKLVNNRSQQDLITILLNVSLSKEHFYM